VINLAVEPADSGSRIDQFLAQHLELPRPLVQEALRRGDVLVNGRSVRPSHKIETGETISGQIERAVVGLPQAEDIPLDVRYSDDRLLVVSKPAGLVTHPAGGHATGTLVNALLGLGVPLSQVDPGRPGVVHRLDKDTSGLLLVAKDDAAHAFLSDRLKARAITRRYIALVRGEMKSATGTIEAPIGRHQSFRRRMAVAPGGRSAVTHFTLLERDHGLSLLDVGLETGRTHQIRVHLSHLGHPILGDSVYGGKGERSMDLGLDRPFLHAWRLVFPHPDGDQIEVMDGLPGDLKVALSRTSLEWTPPEG
jgi:23S rRNA pseudouridine1911/1915/1917 synthase